LFAVAIRIAAKGFRNVAPADDDVSVELEIVLLMYDEKTVRFGDDDAVEPIGIDPASFNPSYSPATFIEERAIA
jgi:hypothetical protein